VAVGATIPSVMRLARLRTGSLALALGAMLVAAPALPLGSAAPVALAAPVAQHAPAPPAYLAADTVPPLPACTYADIPTPLNAAVWWRSVLVDTRLALPRSYSPPDLAYTGLPGVSAYQRVRRFVIPDLRAMVAGARAAGVRLRVDSGYRSYAEQATLFKAYLARLGRAKALLRVARPGHSEHQLGTAVDLASDKGTWLWATANSWRYGWVISYPSAQTAVSCYRSEPWHLRYVGRPRAARIHAAAMVPRLWLWIHIPAARA
jgi:D-alanyl-D-alanine carboxypeptidase